MFASHAQPLQLPQNFRPHSLSHHASTCEKAMSHYTRQLSTPAQNGMAQMQNQTQARAPGNLTPQGAHAQQIKLHKRQMQQFYLHKLFDLLSDAEFLPLIPLDPVATVIQVRESMNSSMKAAPYLNQGMQRPDQMLFYGQAAQKTRRQSGHFMPQHFLGAKRNDYAQYKQG